MANVLERGEPTEFAIVGKFGEDPRLQRNNGGQFTKFTFYYNPADRSKKSKAYEITATGDLAQQVVRNFKSGTPAVVRILGQSLVLDRRGGKRTDAAVGQLIAIAPAMKAFTGVLARGGQARQNGNGHQFDRVQEHGDVGAIPGQARTTINIAGRLGKEVVVTPSSGDVPKVEFVIEKPWSPKLGDNPPARLKFEGTPDVVGFLKRVGRPGAECFFVTTVLDEEGQRYGVAEVAQSLPPELLVGTQRPQSTLGSER